MCTNLSGRTFSLPYQLSTYYPPTHHASPAHPSPPSVPSSHAPRTPLARLLTRVQAESTVVSLPAGLLPSPASGFLVSFNYLPYRTLVRFGMDSMDSHITHSRWRLVFGRGRFRAAGRR